MTDNNHGDNMEPCKFIDEKNCYYKQLLRKEQELIDYKKQFKADTKEMENYQNEITRHLESIEYWHHQAKAKEQECEELKERIKCNCFDPKSNNNRCISYNRIAEDYERDLKRLENKIAECEKLKVQLKNSENARNYAEKVCIDIELKKKIYKQALDEIEKELKEDIYCENQECGCDDFEECLKCTKEHISDIINKAKGEGICQ